MTELSELLRVVERHYPDLGKLRRGMLILNRYTIDLGYPGHSASKRQAVAAVRWVKRVRSVVRKLLGIQSARTGRKAT
jgi:hypothetical protein